jgi:hypothetical protein
VHNERTKKAIEMKTSPKFQVILLIPYVQEPNHHIFRTVEEVAGEWMAA